MDVIDPVSKCQAKNFYIPLSNICFFRIASKSCTIIYIYIIQFSHTSHNWINCTLVSGGQCTKYCFDNLPVPGYPDGGGGGHSQLPGQARPHVDVEVLQQGPEEADQEHNHVEEAEPNKSS